MFHIFVFTKSHFNKTVLIFHDFINRCALLFHAAYNRRNGFSISFGTILKTKNNILMGLISRKIIANSSQALYN